MYLISQIMTGIWQKLFRLKTWPQGVLQAQYEKSIFFIFTTSLCACLAPNSLLKIITTQAGLNYFTHSPLNCDLQGFLTYLRSSLFVFSHNFQCCVGIFIIHQWFHNFFLLNFQCCFHLDQSTGGGCRTGRTGNGSVRFSSANNQHSAGRTSPNCGHCCYCRPRNCANQFPRGKTAYASQRRVFSGPVRPYLRVLQHVKKKKKETRKKNMRKN